MFLRIRVVLVIFRLPQLTSKWCWTVFARAWRLNWTDTSLSSTLCPSPRRSSLVSTTSSLWTLVMKFFTLRLPSLFLTPSKILSWCLCGEESPWTLLSTPSWCRVLTCVCDATPESDQLSSWHGVWIESPVAMVPPGCGGIFPWVQDLFVDCEWEFDRWVASTT